jgi:hypothetical protein
MNALKIAAEGAAVGNTDVESTATALGSAWLVNIKGAGNLRHVMAELNATVGAGNVRMSDLVEALGTGILPASKEAGLSLHDVMGALAVFTDEGYQAISAAAQFSTALHFLYNPTQKADRGARLDGPPLRPARAGHAQAAGPPGRAPRPQGAPRGGRQALRQAARGERHVTLPATDPRRARSSCSARSCPAAAAGSCSRCSTSSTATR